jgi:hypothetical protein
MGDVAGWWGAILAPVVAWLTDLPTELRATLANPQFWGAAIVAWVALLVACLLGWGVASGLGLLDARSRAVDRFATSLTTGLVTLITFWAAVRSLGASSFTPIALAIGATLAFAYRDRRTRPQIPDLRTLRTHGYGRLVILSAFFVFAVALLYGTTLAPSPRDGVRPLGFMDGMYYSLLGQELSNTGIETVYSTSGFDAIAGVEAQSWYHWGEPWLASAVISMTGTSALFARHVVALPLLLLATTVLNSLIVQHLASSTSRRAFLLGGIGSLFLAPIPIYGYYATWGRGTVFGITTYGFAIVIVSFLLYLAARRAWTASRAAKLFIGTVAACLVPAHVALAVVGALAVGSVTLARGAVRFRESRSLAGSLAESRAVLVALLLATVTGLWGLATGHGISASSSVGTPQPFGLSWGQGFALTLIGSGVLLALPVGAWIVRRSDRRLSDLFAVALAALAWSALIWGYLIADFNSFHFFYGSLLVFGTPMALVGVGVLLGKLRRIDFHRLAAVVAIAVAVQTAIGVLTTIERLRSFGHGQYDAMPLAMVAAIRALPVEAKIAYACRKLEEFAWWDPRLLGLAEMSARPVIPMCFEGDPLPFLHEQNASEDVENQFFRFAPQRSLYPTSTATPSTSDVEAFMRHHGIMFIYADPDHPNTLVPEAEVVARIGERLLLRLP